MKQLDRRKITELVNEIANNQLQKELKYLQQDVNKITKQNLSPEVTIGKILPIIISSNFIICKNIAIEVVDKFIREKQDD